MIQANAFTQAALAGRAELTIQNPVTGQHVKLKMKQKKDRITKKPSTLYFVDVAISNDEEKGYRKAGVFFSDTRRWIPNKQMVRGDRFWTIVNFLMQSIEQPQNLENTVILHSGHCLRCGRKLTHPESIQSGLGPECSGRVYGAR